MNQVVVFPSHWMYWLQSSLHIDSSESLRPTPHPTGIKLRRRLTGARVAQSI